MSNNLLNKTSNKNAVSCVSFRQLFGLFVLIGMTMFFSIFSRHFFTLSNFKIMIAQGSILLIASMGMTLVILAGSIDLSVGSLIGLGTMLFKGKNRIALGPFLAFGAIITLIWGERLINWFTRVFF